MATLLAGSTFNGVRVWSGNYNSATNTIVGTYAGDSLSSYSTDNTFFGFNSGRYVQDACGNSVMGYRNFRATGGPQPGNADFNVVFGAYTMIDANVPFTRNVAIGTYVMQSVNTSNCNVAIGHKSARCMNSGGKNTFVGYYAGKGASNPSANVGIGKYALVGIGNGNSNVGVGIQALCAVTNGNNNVAIGALAGRSITTADGTIAIGYLSCTSNNFGHTAAGSACMSCFRLGAGSWTNLSDARDKSDVETLPDNLGLNFIRNLRPVKFNFDYRENYVRKCGFEYGTKDGTLKQDFESYGFIAQEIENTLNTIQSDFDALNKNVDGNYQLEYESLISPIIKSLQQTIQRLEFLESKV